MLTLTPFTIKRYPVRKDSFILTMEQSHASILPQTLCSIITNLYELHTTTSTKPPASALPLQKDLSLNMDKRHSNTDAVLRQPLIHPQLLQNQPWKKAQVPHTVPTPLLHSLLGTHAPRDHWRNPIYHRSTLRSALSYGLCWHLALFLKAMATAWDFVSQTRLWALPGN